MAETRIKESLFKIGSSQSLADSICMIGSKFRSFHVLILLSRITPVATRSKVVTRRSSKEIVGLIRIKKETMRVFTVAKYKCKKYFAGNIFKYSQTVLYLLNLFEVILSYFIQKIPVTASD